MDIRDSDGDGIDDRYQSGPGQPAGGDWHAGGGHVNQVMPNSHLGPRQPAGGGGQQPGGVWLGGTPGSASMGPQQPAPNQYVSPGLQMAPQMGMPGGYMGPQQPMPPQFAQPQMGPFGPMGPMNFGNQPFAPQYGGNMQQMALGGLL